jgi:GT2 family glycosyltransferase
LLGGEMIHVLTLTWNGLPFLKKLKSGLFKNLKKTKQEYKWYIRSNGCNDGTVDEISKWANTEVLKINHNMDSYSNGVNSLFRLAKPKGSDLILLLNNDVEFKDDISLRNMLHLMNKTNAAVCGCRMMFPNSNKISHVGVCLSGNHNSLPWHLRVGEQLDNNDKKDRYFQAVTAACCFVRANNLERAGLFDNQLYWAFDDISLCLEISLNQKEKIVCCGRTEIEHETSATLKKNNYNKLYLKKNVNYFKSKWGGKYKLDYNTYLRNRKYNVVK